MDNYNNLVDPNIEYSNIVYGEGVNTVPQMHIASEPQQTQQNPELLLPHQIQDHPQPVIIDGVNSELKSTNLDDITRHTIIQSATNHENVYHNEIDSVNPPILENHTNYPEAAMDSVENNVSNNAVESEHLNNNDEEKSEEMVGENETKVPVATENKSVASPTTNKSNATETNNNTKKDEDVDPNQCRVCLSKIDLIDIFLVEETNLRFSDKIIVICPNVRILKNDYLPHFICTTCLQNLKIAYDFKKLCETTDSDLRKKLKRSKNKVRRPTEFVLIDCDDFSESSDDNKNKDDDEFHLSGSLSEADTSGSDYSIEKKRRRPPRRRAAATRSSRSAPKRGTSNTNTSSKRKRSSRTSGGGNSTVEIKTEDASPITEKRTRREIVLIKAAEDSDEEDDLPLKQRTTKASTGTSKAKSAAKPVTPKPDSKPNICPYCDKLFPSQSQLREHKKVHSQDTPYICGNCTKEFKQKSNFTAHIMKHKDLSTGKMSCEKPKPKQARTSGGGASGGNGASSVTTSGGGGSSSSSVQKTGGGGGGGGGSSSSGVGSADKKKKSEFEMTNFGRDLFKCVAPLTTTYWSDSFSD